VTAATDTPAITEKLLEVVVSVGYVKALYQAPDLIVSVCVRAHACVGERERERELEK
jgi:hypothetical protein